MGVVKKPEGRPVGDGLGGFLEVRRERAALHLSKLSRRHFGTATSVFPAPSAPCILIPSFDALHPYELLSGLVSISCLRA
jgi:hypothetical protein